MQDGLVGSADALGASSIIDAPRLRRPQEDPTNDRPKWDNVRAPEPR